MREAPLIPQPPIFCWSKRRFQLLCTPRKTVIAENMMKNLIAMLTALLMPVLCLQCGLAQFRQSAGDSIQNAIRDSASDHDSQPPAPQPATSPLVDGATPEIIGDPSGFEWKPYLNRVREDVRNNWLHLINSSERDFRHRKGKTVVAFTVHREGEIQKPEITLSSDQEDLDHLAVQSILLSSPLPPLPKGKVYQAWTLPKGAKAVQPSLTFSPNADGVAVVALPVDASKVGAVAVSVEPEGGSKTPTTTPTFVRPIS